jgi:membrane-associated phospholipid phosphatase
MDEFVARTCSIVSAASRWRLIVAIAGSVAGASNVTCDRICPIGELASWAVNNLMVAVAVPATGRAHQASRSSFPSGHAAFAAVTAILVVDCSFPSEGGPDRRSSPGCSCSRWRGPGQRVHWLTDVVGGSCVGLGSDRSPSWYGHVGRRW